MSSNFTPRKTVCPITSVDEFNRNAEALEVVIRTTSGKELYVGRMEAKEFSTLSLGWNASDKATVPVGPVPVKVQIGVNVTVIGSKEIKREGQAAA